VQLRLVYVPDRLERVGHDVDGGGGGVGAGAGFDVGDAREKRVLKRAPRGVANS
jgi:hypothetical protein